MTPPIGTAARSLRRDIGLLASNIVEDFDRGDLDPYTGTTGSFDVNQTDPVYEGDYSLNVTGSYDEIVSTSGLPNYPSASDEKKYVTYVYIDTGDVQYGFGAQDTDNSYFVRVGPNTNILKKSGGNFNTLVSESSPKVAGGEWIRSKMSGGLMALLQSPHTEPMGT